MTQAQPHPEPAIAPEDAAENTRRCTRVLLDIMDRGHELAQLVHTQAMNLAIADVKDPYNYDGRKTAADFTIPYERIACCVRRTILLIEKLAEPKPTGYDIALAAQHRSAGRKPALISRDPPPDTERTERAGHHERVERVESVDHEFNDDHRPLAEIITDICADLGIAPPGDIARWAHKTLTDLITAGASPKNVHPKLPPPSLTATQDRPAPENPPQTPYPLRL